MQTLVKVYDRKFGLTFTFRTFYGTWQRKRALRFIQLMAEKNIKSEIL